MAVALQSAGMTDIASSLAQDEIPFKLRCAICNKLAINAFRLPCCDQAICENCQTSLPDTCPVCAHTPVTPDLCKPNKALRVTLKAFLRTEEKKRERERPLAPPATPTVPDLAAQPQQSPPADRLTVESAAEAVEAVTTERPCLESEPVERAIIIGLGDRHEASSEARTQHDNTTVNSTTVAEPGDVATTDVAVGQEGLARIDKIQNSEGNVGPFTGQMLPNDLSFGLNSEVLSNIGWGGNSDFSPTAQVMQNGMFGYQNFMGGMPGMTVDTMAAAQEMLGGFGMNMNLNMNGMNTGMNMGMNFNAGQGLYGSGWDSSRQGTMWNGGQDKFNPNAFANGIGPGYCGPAFGGYNMSQPSGNYAQMRQHPPQHQFANSDYQNGYYGPGGRDKGYFRGRGRGFSRGRGRGDFASHMHQNNYPTNAPYSAFPNQSSPSLNVKLSIQAEHGELAEAAPAVPTAEDSRESNDELPPSPQEDMAEHAQNRIADETTAKGAASATDVAEGNNSSSQDPKEQETQQLHVIPTLESIDEASHTVQPFPGDFSRMRGRMFSGYGYGGYGRGGRGGDPFNPPLTLGSNQFNARIEPRGQGVEGAPAAPRAMREGLPNTSILRQQAFQGHARASNHPPQPSIETGVSDAPAVDSDVAQRSPQASSLAKSRSPSRSRARSKSKSLSRRPSVSLRQHDSRSTPTSASGTAGNDGQPELGNGLFHPDRNEYDHGKSAAADESVRSRSASPGSSQKPSNRRDPGKDRTEDRRTHRSRRHRGCGHSHSRSRSRDHSPSASRDEVDLDSVARVETHTGNTLKSARPEKSVGAAHRLEHSSKFVRDSSSRHDDERETRRRDRDRDKGRTRRHDRNRDADEGRERDRQRDRDKPKDKDGNCDPVRRRHRTRGREKERDRDGDHGKEKEKEKEWDRERHRERRHYRRDRERRKESKDREKKQSHRGHSESPDESEHSSRHVSRLKEHFVRNNGKPQEKDAEREKRKGKTPRFDQNPHPAAIQESEPEKDLLALEREARNRERLLKEQQRREAMTGRKRRSAADGDISGGRRVRYKYEDEESDGARADRVEREREASRWV